MTGGNGNDPKSGRGGGRDRRSGSDRRSGQDRRRADRRQTDRRPANGEEGGGAATIPPDSRTAIVDLSGFQPASSRLETAKRGFLILVGALPGEDRLPLTGPKTVVGREGADIVIDDSALSRRHFEIEARAEEFFIRDLDSSNGTFVNNERIRTSQLAAGDRIQAGETTFSFSVLEVLPLDRPE